MNTSIFTGRTSRPAANSRKQKSKSEPIQVGPPNSSADRVALRSSQIEAALNEADRFGSLSPELPSELSEHYFEARSAPPEERVAKVACWALENCATRPETVDYALQDLTKAMDWFLEAPRGTDLTLFSGAKKLAGHASRVGRVEKLACLTMLAELGRSQEDDLKEGVAWGASQVYRLAHRFPKHRRKLADTALRAAFTLLDKRTLVGLSVEGFLIDPDRTEDEFARMYSLRLLVAQAPAEEEKLKTSLEAGRGEAGHPPDLLVTVRAYAQHLANLDHAFQAPGWWAPRPLSPPQVEKALERGQTVELRSKGTGLPVVLRDEQDLKTAVNLLGELGSRPLGQTELMGNLKDLAQAGHRFYCGFEERIEVGLFGAHQSLTTGTPQQLAISWGDSHLPLSHSQDLALLKTLQAERSAQELERLPELVEVAGDLAGAQRLVQWLEEEPDERRVADLIEGGGNLQEQDRLARFGLAELDSPLANLLNDSLEHCSMDQVTQALRSEDKMEACVSLLDSMSPERFARALERLGPHAENMRGSVLETYLNRSEETKLFKRLVGASFSREQASTMTEMLRKPVGSTTLWERTHDFEQLGLFGKVMGVPHDLEAKQAVYQAYKTALQEGGPRETVVAELNLLRESSRWTGSEDLSRKLKLYRDHAKPEFRRLATHFMTQFEGSRANLSLSRVEKLLGQIKKEADSGQGKPEFLVAQGSDAYEQRVLARFVADQVGKPKRELFLVCLHRLEGDQLKRAVAGLTLPLEEFLDRLPAEPLRTARDRWPQLQEAIQKRVDKAELEKLPATLRDNGFTLEEAGFFSALIDRLPAGSTTACQRWQDFQALGLVQKPFGVPHDYRLKWSVWKQYTDSLERGDSRMEAVKSLGSWRKVPLVERPSLPPDSGKTRASQSSLPTDSFQLPSLTQRLAGWASREEDRHSLLTGLALEGCGTEDKEKMALIRAYRQGPACPDLADALVENLSKPDAELQALLRERLVEWPGHKSLARHLLEREDDIRFLGLAWNHLQSHPECEESLEVARQAWRSDHQPEALSPEGRWLLTTPWGHGTGVAKALSTAHPLGWLAKLQEQNPCLETQQRVRFLVIAHQRQGYLRHSQLADLHRDVEDLDFPELPFLPGSAGRLPWTTRLALQESQKTW